jgi:hypothetical protein
MANLRREISVITLASLSTKGLARLMSDCGTTSSGSRQASAVAALGDTMASPLTLLPGCG